MKEPESDCNGYVAAPRKRDYKGPLTGGEGICPGCGEAIVYSRGGQERVKRGYVAFCAQCINGMLAQTPREDWPEAELPTRAEVSDAVGFTGRN